MRSYLVLFGDRSAFAALAEDVGERERLQRQLRQSQRLESLGQLAGGVAHDFNNLLGVIVAYAGLLRGAGPRAPGRGAAWRISTRSSSPPSAARELTRQLLIFSRREITQPSVIDVGDVIDRARSAAPAGARRARPQRHADCRRPVAGRDRSRAARAGPRQPGGQRARRDARAAGSSRSTPATSTWTSSTASLSPACPPADYLVLRVSDTGMRHGPGRTASACSSRSSPPRRQGEGTGLGLSTVLRDLTQAGGRVQVYSELGHGTTFTVCSRPSRRPSAGDRRRHRRAPAYAAAARRSSSSRTRTALRDATVRMLARHGYRVLSAADGHEAIAIAGRAAGDRPAAHRRRHARDARPRGARP